MWKYLWNEELTSSKLFSYDGKLKSIEKISLECQLGILKNLSVNHDMVKNLLSLLMRKE